MKVDCGVSRLADVPERARVSEAAGYDGIWSAETSHDPFLPLGIAAEHTSTVELGTGVAVAFPRSPMQLANVGHDLQLFSEGRFILGLGSQVKTHVENRFSATWSRPAARMRELVLALRAIWSCWNDGEKLNFVGDFYRHTLMTPFFNPGRNPFGSPKVFLASVGPQMTEVVGEVADGVLTHGLTTPRYLREVTLPALERGLRKSGRDRSHVEVSCPIFVVTGTNEEEFAAAQQRTREVIAFYASTPAYKGVLDLHGWGPLQQELNALSKQGRWTEMGGLIDDEMLDAVAVQGSPAEVGESIVERFGDAVDRVSFVTRYRMPALDWAPVLQRCHAAPAPAGRTTAMPAAPVT